MKTLIAIISTIILLAACGQPKITDVQAKPTKWNVYVEDTTYTIFFRDFDKAETIIKNTFNTDSVSKVN